MKNVVFEQFESLVQMCEALNSRPTCKGAGRASHEGEDTGHGRDWSGTDTYAEADGLAMNGDKESLRMINAAVRSMHIQARNTRNTEERAMAKTSYSIVGSRPCVPRAINGHPLSMCRRTTVRVNRPVLNVYYSRSAMANVEATEMAKVGAKVIEAIKSIERGGVRINLYVGAIIAGDTEDMAIFARAKDSDKDIDFARLAYPFVNPAFFRRHVFRHIETKKELNQRHWHNGYGHRENDEKGLFYRAKNNDKNNVFISFYGVRNMTTEQIAAEIIKK